MEDITNLELPAETNASILQSVTKNIPLFYKPRASNYEDSIQHRLNREARASLLHLKTQSLLGENDLQKVLSTLRGHACHKGGPEELEYIDYAGFCHAREALSDPKFASYFTAVTFLKFPRNSMGRIAIIPFFSYVVRKVSVEQTRIQLSYYDMLGYGYLRESDMENFVYEIIPTLPQLENLQLDFYPFYVFTAVRKFFFFLDPLRRGRVAIADLLSSSILPELYDLRIETPLLEEEARNNWFTVPSTMKVYNTYLELDSDANGMLSKLELRRFGSGMVTPLAIDRIFQEYQTYEGEVDYKTYLDFVIAMENRSTESSIRYFWRILDIDKKGFISRKEISLFFRSVNEILIQNNLNQAGCSVEDVCDEIIDMITVTVPGKISLKDLLKSKQGGTVVSMLIDGHSFWAYDNRESVLLQAQQEEAAAAVRANMSTPGLHIHVTAAPPPTVTEAEGPPPPHQPSAPEIVTA